jgi:hypothetical protein
MDESRRLAMRRKHADRYKDCPLCGKRCFGNGAYPSHKKKHLRERPEAEGWDHLLFLEGKITEDDYRERVLRFFDRPIH